MSHRKGKFIGAVPELHGHEAIVRDHELRGRVLAQFDDQLLPGTSIKAKPGQGRDEEIPYCFGWHEFLESEFEFERTEGHGPSCRCLECWPEPHSMDQLRRRF